ncbi:hypothetical protein LTR53_009604 [Teratosphaeriaceae sp. CCFEE 6253]|nr:hypothetical protein LTR53_009604 [Teratosphaeriaceae sp. CCFEE 6253]
MSPMARVLIYLVRRDMRLADNPILHELARLHKQSQKPFTHVLPVFVYTAEQLEVSGFLAPGETRSPYPEARSDVGGFWRCGRLRAKFLGESVWDLKKDLERVGSGLEIRVGMIQDVVRSILDGYRERSDAEVHGFWMANEDAWEEHDEQGKIRELCDKEDKEFRLFTDEKYFVDDRDLPITQPRELSDVFTNFRKTVEPLRQAPRKELPTPTQLPPLPDFIPPQFAPFAIPDTQEGMLEALVKPIHADLEIPGMPKLPADAISAHPYRGGAAAGHARIRHLLESGAMSKYKDTRNGLLGLDFSTKLSAWLALGSITARQVHWRMLEFEDAATDLGATAQGYGKGENKGTAAVRFELLWRDYMRLCTRKFGTRLFYLAGYRHDKNAQFKMVSSPYSDSTAKKNTKGSTDAATRATVERWFRGETGTGLIDASQRELFLTGWTSNRARQNVASYLTKHLGIDWRLGAEWYEANLVDYDVHSNWGNWQYVAGVGNDPRGNARVFNPVKQAVDYDPRGAYVRAWVPELRDVGQGPEAAAEGGESAESLMGVFQAWRIPAEEKRRLGLEGVEWVEKPLVRINFNMNRRAGGGGSGAKRGGREGYRGRGRGGKGRGGGGGGGPNQGRGARSGAMEKAGWAGQEGGA